ncbi:MAG: SpoIIIAH-like family protein [Bacilli bacterium]|nr:SpoIIIAH-like family protein [Bacilli bacterium]
MINKQNLWFLTLFSLILVLGIYYVTMPNDLLTKVNVKAEETKEKAVVEEVKEESALVAMRVSLEEERKSLIDNLQGKITNEKLTTEEKNNAYEQLKYLNSLQGKEETIEKKIKKEYDLDCFTKIDNSDVSVICISSKHDATLANNIMRTIQKDSKTKLNITVKFQKK